MAILMVSWSCAIVWRVKVTIPVYYLCVMTYTSGKEYRISMEMVKQIVHTLVLFSLSLPQLY